MSQEGDDSIEQFFRKAVVRQDKSSLERDWARMEQMLDDHAMEIASANAARSAKAFKAGAVVAIIALLLLMGIHKRSTHGDNHQMAAAVDVLGQQVAKQMAGTTAALVPSFQDCHTHDMSNATAKTAPAAIDKAVSADNHHQTGKRVPSNASPLSSQTETASVTASFRNLSEGIQRSDPDFVSEEKELIIARDTQDVSVVTDPRVNQAIAPVDDSYQTPHPGLVNAPYDSTAGKAGSARVVQTDEEKAAATGSSLKRINITTLISPDFSTTSLTKYSKPSGVFGLLLGYRVTNRFIVMSGVTKSTKRYEGYGREYSPPEGYWTARTNGVIPDEVEGKCGIIEVPLMIQYDVLQRKRSRVFVSAGLSSYFMRSEHYQYTFNEPNPGAAESWTAKEPTRYLFKIGHLSAGFDRMISKRFSLGIEPFLKLPFEGIGWTNISLYSAGANLNVRYNILDLHQD